MIRWYDSMRKTVDVPLQVGTVGGHIQRPHNLKEPSTLVEDVVHSALDVCEAGIARLLGKACLEFEPVSDIRALVIDVLGAIVLRVALGIVIKKLLVVILIG